MNIPMKNRYPIWFAKNGTPVVTGVCVFLLVIQKNRVASRFADWCLFLAMRAEKRGAPAKRAGLQGRAEGGAGLAFFAVNPEFMLEIAKLAIGLAVIAQAAAAFLNGLF